MVVEYKGQEFEQNPNQVSEAMQFKGEIYIKYADHPCMDVYGFSESQVIEQVKKLKEIEPRTFVVEIFGPENHFSPRTYVSTQYFYQDMTRSFLVAFTASCSNGIMTDTVELYIPASEKANQRNFEKILNCKLKPSYVKNIISWSLIED